MTFITYILERFFSCSNESLDMRAEIEGLVLSKLIMTICSIDYEFVQMKKFTKVT